MPGTAAEQREPFFLSWMAWGATRTPHNLAPSAFCRPPPPLLLFVCLITKQKLQSDLLYFCM